MHSENNKACNCSCCEHEEEHGNFLSELAEELEKPIYIIISFIALLCTLILSLTMKDGSSGVKWYDYISLVAVVLSGFPLIYSGIYNLFVKRRIKSSLLITIAIFASIYIGEIFTAGEVALLMALGEYLEDRTVEKAKNGISRLMKLVPNDVSVLEDGKEIKKHIDEVEVGEVIKLRPGETIALDGVVVNGNSAVDQRNITGESLPIDVHKGSKVYSGSVNMQGTIDVEVTNIADNSSMQRMIALMRMTDSSKSRIENTADKWSAILVPVALLIALIVYIVTQDIVRTVSVLVVFCPCAFTLATPTCIVAAIGHAGKNGVLIKDKNAVENLAKSNLMAFDKTGTLTSGRLTVSEVVPLGSESPEEILRLAASLEYSSEHPLAKAIVMQAEKDNVQLHDVKDFKAIAGWGIEGSIDGVKYSISRTKHSAADELASEGKATMILKRGDEDIAVIALSDEIKENSASTISALKEQGVNSVLLSGDNQSACKHIAEKLNIEHYKAELMPEDKLKYIAKFRENHTVSMVGDGMNDAPALKSADVSICMADSGSDVSVEASDIVLLGDDIGKLPYIKRLCCKTLKNIKLNLSVAMIINLAAVVLSIMGLLSPVFGALMHNLGSVFVTLNAARLYRVEIEK